LLVWQDQTKPANMADSIQSLSEKYKVDNDGSATDVHQKILNMAAPSWSKYEATAGYAQELKMLVAGKEAGWNKASFNKGTATACMAVLAIKDDASPLQYILTVLYDMLREDGSCYGLFDDALKDGCNIYKPVMAMLERSREKNGDAYAADKGAWLLSAIIGHSPKYFSQQDVKLFVSLLMTGTACTELGVLEAVANLLKSEAFRATTWNSDGVPKCIFKVDPKAASPVLYKCVFAIWMLSFDVDLIKGMKNYDVIKKLKALIVYSRVEKVIRLCLTVLKNFLTQKAYVGAGICEDIVEEGVLEAVQALEYEKWRDADLYDDIKEVAQSIQTEVSMLSNFDRYMKELESGTLAWGFIHSSKFWGENVMKFEQDGFKALKLLANLLTSDNATTVAVACHDLGEFVSLHPLGKKKVSQLGVKERVMELMGSTDPNYREVRREALLCCQKIMLNKWQDVAGPADKK